MTVGGMPATEPAGRTRREAGVSSLPEAVAGLCPFILGPDGARMLDPSREQRCTAVSPAALLSPDKQRRLCLTAGHASCATFRAATSEAALDAGGPAADGALPGAVEGVARAPRGSVPRRWRVPITAPVVVDPGRALPTAALRRRGTPQLGLAMLMVAAFAVLLAARLSQGPVSLGADTSLAPSSPVASAAASLTAEASVPPSASPEASHTPAPSATVAPSPSPSAPVATPSPSTVPTLPTTNRTYTVRSGDTLAAIAARFGTTVKAIATANHITDPRLIHIGQVLVIP